MLCSTVVIPEHDTSEAYFTAQVLLTIYDVRLVPVEIHTLIYVLVASLDYESELRTPSGTQAMFIFFACSNKRCLDALAGKL